MSASERKNDNKSMAGDAYLEALIKAFESKSDTEAAKAVDDPDPEIKNLKQGIIVSLFQDISTLIESAKAHKQTTTDDEFIADVRRIVLPRYVSAYVLSRTKGVFVTAKGDFLESIGDPIKAVSEGKGNDILMRDKNKKYHDDVRVE